VDKDTVGILALTFVGSLAILAITYIGRLEYRFQEKQLQARTAQ
jgi:hypothetical protein